MVKTQFPEELELYIDNWKDKKGNLIMILHAIQDYYGYVPKEEAFKLSKIINIPVARIYEVLTFYNYFSLDPPGKHKISVCMGTACYLKGSSDILKELQNILKTEVGKTTDDKLFKLEIVRCVGCCGLAPVIMIDDKVFGKLTIKEVPNIIEQYKKEG